ncbi:MAG TPA: SRPBCC family protein [Kineosporiaceae bacterium]|nr:SRPBCC family protein [Kineosporiaceae bacterium]
MGDIVVTVEQAYDASAETVFGALADYAAIRPTILAPEITDYQVLEGGAGAGTRISYHLHATKKRVRQVDASVAEPVAGKQLLEADRNSSLEVLWDVAANAAGRSQVTVRVSWQGATGIGGFFERRFAPAGIGRIYRTELERLQSALA